MFDVGFAELFLLALIGLLVLGPERLPGVARTLGGFVRKARASWSSLRNTIESELEQADISAPIKQAREELKRIGKELPDIKDFTPDYPAINTAEPDPDDKQQDDPAQDSDSKKDDNV